jgi:hypothetical protein
MGRHPQGRPRPSGRGPYGDREPVDEYHVWPTAAAGGWTVLSGAGDKDSRVEPPQEELK